MSVLCEPLQKILDAELESGNEIVGADSGAFSKIDYIVYLKLPFGKNYLDELPETDVEFYANKDAHYNLGESYSSAKFRQAIEAPFAEGS